MILTLDDVADFKKKVSETFSQEIHFHDGCGGQYFSLDKQDDRLKAYIVNYCADRNLRAVFSADGLYFTVETQTTR